MALTKFYLALPGVFVVFLFSSCIKTLDDELPQTEPKLVINGIVNPDSVLQVNISKTVHIFANESSNNAPFIHDATVRAFRDGQFLFNLEEDENGYYSKTGFYPSQAHSYKIEVEKAGFKTVFAETDIPEPVSIKSVDTSIITDVEYGYVSTTIKCKLKYNDPPGMENYYRLDCYVSYIDENGDEVIGKQYIYVDEGSEYLFDRSWNYLLWNDILIGGNESSVDFYIYTGYYEGEKSKDTISLTYTLLFTSLSEDYYKYDKTRGLYFENGGTSDPFSEPVLIYTNVTNGFGIFGGSSNDTTSFKYLYNFQNP
jgi:hypothetical protein